MLEVAMTGHTRGIGKALYKTLTSNFKVKGFSRSNGYDISTVEGRLNIFEESKNANIFINNAYFSNSQVELFTLFFENWLYDESKTIVNISSQSKYPGMSRNWSGYSAYKAALNHQAYLCGFKTDRKCRLITINPGLVKTDMTLDAQKVGKGMITPEEVAHAVEWAISLPQHIEIGELSLWYKSPDQSR
jgi:NAD(P)-dependent dehydrogenase (short-subunit alcohol dehydrogenase family)